MLWLPVRLAPQIIMWCFLFTASAAWLQQLVTDNLLSFVTQAIQYQLLDLLLFRKTVFTCFTCSKEGPGSVEQSDIWLLCWVSSSLFWWHKLLGSWLMAWNFFEGNGDTCVFKVKHHYSVFLFDRQMLWMNQFRDRSGKIAHLHGSLLMGAVMSCLRWVLLVTALGLTAAWLILSKEDTVFPVKPFSLGDILQLIPTTARSIPG